MPSVPIITTQQNRISQGPFRTSASSHATAPPGSHIRTAPAHRPVAHRSRPPLCARTRRPYAPRHSRARPQRIRRARGPPPLRPRAPSPRSGAHVSGVWAPLPGPAHGGASSSPTRFSHHRTNPLGPTDRARQQGGERGKEEQPRLTRRPGPHVTGPANRERRASETSPTFPRHSLFHSPSTSERERKNNKI